MNKPNPELLKKVRDGLARYNEARKTTYVDGLTGRFLRIL